MKLILTLTSPFARKIRIMLLEKQLPFEIAIDSPLEVGTQVGAYNPLVKVPVLIADDGEVFFESPVIAGYLETLGAAPALLPAAPRERVRVRQIEALADGITEAAVAVVLHARLSSANAGDPFVPRQMDKITRALDALEPLAAAGEYLHPSGYGLGDIAAGVALAYLDFRFPDLQWRDAHPASAALERRLAARPSFAATVPPAS